jgi:thiosulfate/3-mercaptopyruvate sulfurtransferase
MKSDSIPLIPSSDNHSEVSIDVQVTRLPVVCDVQLLSDLIEKNAVRVVDVRRVEEYYQEHIPSAVSLPLAKLLEHDSPTETKEILESLGIEDGYPVVVYDDTFGALAARVAWSFQYIGHSNTALLQTTFNQWKKMGLQTESIPNSFPRKQHSLNINDKIYADSTYVQTAQNSPGKIIIDSRERLNYLTEHIPGAKNMPYTMIGGNGNVIRNSKDIERYIENRGISNDTEIITYCGSVGTLSGLTYYALKQAGIKNVRLYSKSFKEWKSLGKPKEEINDANYWDLSAE